MSRKKVKKIVEKIEIVKKNSNSEKNHSNKNIDCEEIIRAVKKVGDGKKYSERNMNTEKNIYRDSGKI